MEWTEQDISLIDDYLTGNLSGEALSGFEARLSAEPALAEAVSAQRELMEAARLEGRESLRQSLQAIHLEVVGSIGVKDYSPSQGRGGSSFLNGLIALILVSAIAAISYYLFVVLKILSPGESGGPVYHNTPMPAAPAPRQDDLNAEIRVNQTKVDTVRVYKDAKGNVVAEERLEGEVQSDTTR